MNILEQSRSSQVSEFSNMTEIEIFVCKIELLHQEKLVVWPMLFSFIFADVLIRHSRITTKEELKTVL